jgi:hypothetical protein
MGGWLSRLVRIQRAATAEPGLIVMACSVHEWQQATSERVDGSVQSRLHGKAGSEGGVGDGVVWGGKSVATLIK